MKTFFRMMIGLMKSEEVVQVSMNIVVTLQSRAVLGPTGKYIVF